MLQSQYKAAKEGVNSQQLALYYSIGGYISAIDLKHLSLFYTA